MRGSDLERLLHGLLLLAVLWWAWAAYAWLTNTLNPEEGGVRLVVFCSIGAMLVVLLAVPNSFGPDGINSGLAYFVGYPYARSWIRSRRCYFTTEAVRREGRARGGAPPRAERHPWRGVDSAERAVPTVNEAALECRRPSLPEPNAPY